jgi:hypothetical protein
MPDPKDGKHNASRRTFLKQVQWAPVLFLPAPICSALIPPGLQRITPARAPQFPFASASFVPHYPAKSSLEDLLRLAAPGTDEYVVEGYAFELSALLEEWGQHVKVGQPATATMSKFVDSSIQSTALRPIRETPLRAGDRIEVFRREFSPEVHPGRERFLKEIARYLAPLKKVETADFEIYECTAMSDSPLTIEAKIRYDFVGTRDDRAREE